MQLANGSQDYWNRCTTANTSSIITEFGDQFGDQFGEHLEKASQWSILIVIPEWTYWGDRKIEYATQDM